VTSPYELGWQQGSVFAHQLTTSVIIGSTGSPESRAETFETWIVAAEDCTLYQSNVTDDEAMIELRPVLTADPPALLGIRSRKFKLTGDGGDPRYCDDHAVHLMISPLAISQIDPGTSGRDVLPDDRRRAFKAWLSRRYARAAVPEDYVALGRALYQAHLRQRSSIDEARITELFWDVEDRPDGTRSYELIALIEDEADHDDVVEWLYSVVQEVPRELGEVSRIEAGTEEQLPIAVLTRTYLFTSELTLGK
jgi:hypothetical protein